jgi:hypothetical protein
VSVTNLSRLYRSVAGAKHIVYGAMHMHSIAAASMFVRAPSQT